MCKSQTASHNTPPGKC